MCPASASRSSATVQSGVIVPLLPLLLLEAVLDAPLDADVEPLAPVLADALEVVLPVDELALALDVPAVVVPLLLPVEVLDVPVAEAPAVDDDALEPLESDLLQAIS